MSPKTLTVSLLVGILAGGATGYCQQNGLAADAKLTVLGEPLPQKFINRAVPHDVASAILANGNTSDQALAKMFSLYSAASGDQLQKIEMIERPIDDLDPPIDSPLIVVNFPVHTEGYLVSGQVSGSMARNYRTPPSSFIAAANIRNYQGVPLNVVYPSILGWLTTGEKIAAKDEWVFAMNQIPAESPNSPRKYLYKFTYHHGHNTRSHWASGFGFNWYNNTLARVIDRLTHTATQGGNYYTTSNIVNRNDIPTHWSAPGLTQITWQRNLPIVPYGTCYLEKVELHYAEPSSITSETISFNQFYKTMPANGNLDISLPGVGVYDFDCDFVEGTTTVQNLSVTKHTETTYMTTYITPDELALYFNGSRAYCAACMTANMSCCQDPWPDRTAAQPQVIGAGGKTFFRAVLQ